MRWPPVSIGPWPSWKPRVAEAGPRLRLRLRAAWAKYTDGLSFQPVAILLLSTVVLILFHENGNSQFFRQHFGRYFGPSSYGSLYPALYWFGCSFVMLGAIPLLIGRFGLKQPIRDWGVGLGDWKTGLLVTGAFYLLFLPVLIYVSTQPAFQAKYPLFPAATKSFWHFVLYEAAYAVYFIGWEFIYRGFMLFGLKPKLGYYAVFIQTIPFAIMHFGKPQAETLAAVGAGVILGYLALRTRSFWYGWLLHAAIAFTNDLLAIYHKGGIGPPGG